MKTICLVMIVKDESAIIRRCLDSVKPFIDHWVICDTGSTDDTKEIVRQTLKAIPGTLYEDAWLDFGYNRTLSLERSRGKADYLLMLNADEVLHTAAEFRADLESDAYRLRYEGDIDYALPLLLNATLDWRFVGVTHEHLHSDHARTIKTLCMVTLRHMYDGGSRVNKFGRDIMLLTNALKEDPANSRYLFYLAQSYKDVGLHERALEFYHKRTEMGGWEEEVWYAGYQAGRMQHLLGQPWPVVLDSYLAAYQYRPTRLEPIYHIAKFYNETKQHHLAYPFAQLCREAPYPDDFLFIERNIYRYELPLEYGICCYWTGRHEEAIRVNEAILATPNVPPEFLEMARRNRLFSVEALRA